MFETQWKVAPMGGLLGWDGFKPAIDLLMHGFRVTGVELMAEVERLKILELAQLEIESARAKYLKALADRKQRTGIDTDGVEHTEGDIDDFFEDALIDDED